MKKIFLLLVTVILTIAFTACSGAKKTEAANNEVAETVEVSDPQPEAPVLSPAEMLKDFKEYAKAYGEAFNNITKDPNKYSELARQSQKRVEEMEKIKTELDKKQSEEYQKSLDIVLKVNRGGK